METIPGNIITVELNRYVLVSNNTGKLIAVDMNSGGYPYETTNFQSVRFWKTKEEAENYHNMFAKYKWSVFKVNSIQLEKV